MRLLAGKDRKKEAEDPVDTGCDRSDGWKEAVLEQKERMLSKANPLCRTCRRFSVKLVFGPHPWADPESTEKMKYVMGCVCMGDVRAEGTECCMYVSEECGCGNCAHGTVLGTMLGGRKVMSCALGKNAEERNICEHYARATEGDEDD